MVKYKFEQLVFVYDSYMKRNPLTMQKKVLSQVS
jgi:hypothetical protein